MRPSKPKRPQSLQPPPATRSVNQSKPASKAPKPSSDSDNEQLFPILLPSPSMQLYSSDINAQIFQNFNYIIENFKLINPDTGQPYHFSENYQALGTFIVLYIQCLLKESGLLEMWVPREDPIVNIFHTQDFFTNNKKLLVIIHGRGKVRAGQWSRKICLNDDLVKGSVIPYVEQATSLGYAVIILNPNFNKAPYTRANIPHNSTMDEHCEYIWTNFIQHSPAQSIAIIAHSCGGVCTLNLLKNHSKEFYQRVKKIALLDSVHKTIAGLNVDAQRYFSKVALNWKKSQKRLGAVEGQGRNEGCRCVSAGDPRHEYTASSAQREVFPFLETKIAKR